MLRGGLHLHRKTLRASLALIGLISYLILLPSSSSFMGTVSPPGTDSPGNLKRPEPGVSFTTEGVSTLTFNAALPGSPSITASKSHSLTSDLNNDGKVNPGDTLTYTIVISNAGTADATAVNFSDTIDPNTMLVGGSVNSSPIAFDDTYTATGNIPIAPATSVLSNDIDPDTGSNTGLTLTQVQGSGANIGVATNTTATGIGGVHGSVTMQSSGTFTYEPPPGFAGNDTFTYQISDAGGKTGNGTVTITISNMVWFIDNSSGAANSWGTFSQPFKTIAEFNAVNSGAAPNPQAGHHIVLRPAGGAYAEADGINLQNTQTLTGAAVAFNTVFTADANSTSAYNTFATSTGAAPTITTSAGNGIDLASGNAVRGLNIGNTPGFFGFSGGAVGSLTIGTVSKTGTGGAINVSTSGAFGSNVNFGTLESTSSAGSNLNLVGVTGTLGVSSGGAGFSGSAASSAAININGGSVSLTYAGNVTKANSGALLSVSGGHNGTLTFNTGTLSATAGTGLQFDNADGTYNLNGTNTLNGGDAGVDIVNGSGGSFSFSNNSTITSPTGTAFNVNTGSPAVTYSGTITQNNAVRAIDIQGTISNTVTFGGTVTGGASSSGVHIGDTSAVNGNVSFTTLNLGTSVSRMTSQAVTITNGGSAAIYSLGTVSIFTTGASAQGIAANSFDGVLNSTAGTVDASGAAAINISGPAGFTALGMTLTKVAANGGTSGIILTNTSGSFTVTGNGADATVGGNGTGGTITGMTGPGVNLTTVSNISFTSMTVQSGSDDGIRGNSVTVFTLSHCSVLNNGNATTERGVEITNLLGSATVSNSKVNGNAEDNLWVQNSTGTLNQLTVTNSEFKNTSTSVGNDGIHFEGLSGATMTINVSGSTFDHNRGDHFQMTTDAVASGTVMTAIVQNNAMTGDRGTTYGGTDLGGCITINPGGAAQFHVKVSGNTITGAVSSAITLDTSNTSSLEGTLSNNIIGTAGTIDSGSSQGDGLSIFAINSSTMTVNISGNTIKQYSNLAGVDIKQSSGSAAIQATVTGNTISNGGTFAAQAVIAVAGAATGDSGTMCLDLGGAGVLANSFAGAGANGSTDFRVRQRMATTVRLPGYGGANTDTAAVVAFIQGRNTGSETGNATVNTSTSSETGAPFGGGFIGGAACAGPTTTSVDPALTIASASAVGGDETSTASVIGGDLLRTTSGEAPKDDSIQKLSQSELNWMAQAALQRWSEAGIAAEDFARMQAATFEVVDLPNGQIAGMASGHIKIDETGAGYGWFIDQSPLEDGEFQVEVPGKELQTIQLSPARGKLDLLTVLMRELGQVYLEGKERLPKPMRRNLSPMMEPTLSPGVRRVPLDQFRVTPPITRSTVIDTGKSRIAQEIKPSTSSELAAVEDITNNATPAGDARSSMFNRGANPRTAFADQRPAPAMITKRGSSADSFRATQTKRVALSLPSTPTVSVGPFTLPLGKSVTIMFQVTVNSPFPNGVCTVTNQGTVTGSNFASVMTNTDTATIVIPPLFTSCQSNISANTDPGVCTSSQSFTVTAAGCPAPTITCKDQTNATITSPHTFSKGTTTVTCTASNGNAPDATCTFTVTVSDNRAPVITGCTNISTNTAPGLCTAAPTYTPTATDNCDGSRPLTCNPASGSTFNKGVTTVTCMASDLKTPTPNTSSCSFTVTVTDNQAPVVTCPPSGGAFAASDCLPSQRSAYTGATLYSTGGNAVTNVVLFGMTNCTAPPGSGTTTINFTGTLTGDLTIPPSGPTHFQAPVTGQMKVTFNNLTGSTRTFDTEMLQLEISGGNLPAGVQLRESPTLMSIGQTKITTVTGGFRIDSFFDLFVELSTNSGGSWTPDPTARHIAEVQSTDFGACTAVVNYPAATASDNCDGPLTPTCNPASGSTFAKGTITVTCSSTDSSNFTGNCSFTITVLDTELPTLTCPNNISVTGNSCQVETYTTPTASDNCPGAVVACAPPSGTCFAVGTTTVTCTATDTSGNASNCTFTVSMIPCTVSCPNNIVDNIAPGTCAQVETYADPTTTGMCGTVTCSPASGSSFSKGVTTVTCTASAGTSCSFSVTINDNEAPVFSGCTNASANTAMNACNATVNYTQPTASDACDGMRAVTCNPASGSTFAKGVTTVSCSASDTSNNTANCTFTVTVTDNVPPAFSGCTNVSANTASNSCDALVNYTQPMATDNCDGTRTVSCNPASGSTFAKGVTTVICTATDLSNNTGTCSFTVTVNDTTPPSIICPGIVTHGTDPNQCSAVVTYAAPTVNDNCPNVGAPVCTPASGTVFQKGATTVSCTVTDASNNPASCSFTVTVNDTQNPTVSCPADKTFTTAGNSDPCGIVTYTTPTGSDNCAVQGVVCSPASGTCFPVGMTTVTCTVTDTSSNTGQCTFKVTVSNPCTITCPANITKTNDPNQCGAVATFAPTTTGGGCGTVSCTPASGSFFPKGTTTVTCTTSGPSCQFTVTVNDTQPPSITCPANISQSTDPNQCQAMVMYPAPAVSDNCPNVGAPVCTPASGSSVQKGTTTVTCMVKDASNNMSSCSFTVTVNDTQAPVFPNGCPSPSPMTVVAQPSCPFATTAPVSFTTPTATDDCGTPTVVCSPPAGSQFPVGTTTVTCTATDASNNMTTCTFGVNVFSFCLQDDSSPGNVVFVNASTGDFVFCSGGVQIASGRGTLTVRGCQFGIESVKGDRRVIIGGDTSANNGLGAGNAVIQKANGHMVIHITDRNMTNNTCQCSPSPPQSIPREKPDPGKRINVN